MRYFESYEPMVHVPVDFAEPLELDEVADTIELPPPSFDE